MEQELELLAGDESGSETDEFASPMTRTAKAPVLPLRKRTMLSRDEMMELLTWQASEYAFNWKGPRRQYEGPEAGREVYNDFRKYNMRAKLDAIDRFAERNPHGFSHRKAQWTEGAQRWEALLSGKKGAYGSSKPPSRDGKEASFEPPSKSPPKPPSKSPPQPPSKHPPSKSPRSQE